MKIICNNCNEEKIYYAKNLCQQCYLKQYQINNKEKIIEYKKQYNQNDYNHRIGKCKPMNKNKLCPQYLGIVIAEQVLSKVFKNVEVMPMHNPGYDFICGNGFKIDSKSSCIIIRNKHSNGWSFKINKNKISDYFLCLAFDNRTDLNPLHLWLIPGNIINNKTGISISESTINKWDEYKLDINKVINCCNIFRENIK